MQVIMQCGLILIGLILATVHSAPSEEEITFLPGLPHLPPFKQYSGFLNAIGLRRLHYWLVESELNPAKAPLVLYLNDGPGCSSVYGMLTENGPVRVNYNGKKLLPNPFSWNKVANMLYLDSPVGVGYSYYNATMYNYTTNDDFTALNNYQALLNFFQKFPEYQSNDFYIVGEGYGAIYVPTLAIVIVNNTNKINLKGFAVGNGIHDRRLNANAAVLFGRNHAMFGEEIMAQLLKGCCNVTIPMCNFYDNFSPECKQAMSNLSRSQKKVIINPYSIYKKCEITKESPDYLSFMRHDWKNKDRLKSDNLDLPCFNSWPERQWMNRNDVQKALHIPSEDYNTWAACSGHVMVDYNMTYTTMDWHYRYLLSRVRALVYHGDTDSLCPFLGCEWFVNALGKQLVKEYGPWSYKNETAGFYKEFSNITFATVSGAGRRVPLDRPGQALKLFSNFLYNKTLD